MMYLPTPVVRISESPGWARPRAHARGAFPSLFAVILTFTAGCGENPPAGGNATRPAGTDPDRLLKIAVIPKATNHVFWKAIHAGAIKAEREFDNVQIEWKGPAREDDRAAQIDVVENFINAGVDGIVLAPLDDKALVRPVREATKAGVPVVIMDSGLDASPGDDYVSFVATDNVEGGRNAARRLGHVLGGEGNVILLRYLQGSASTTRREEGFLEEIAQRFPKIRVVSSEQHAGATTAEALATAENLLQAHPDVDGVFCPCEPPTFGMLRVLRNTNRVGKVKLVGFDTSDKLVEAMRNGDLDGLVLQDPMLIGYTAVKTLVEHLRGETVPARIDTGSRVATPENMTSPGIRELLSPPIDEYLE